MYKELPDAADIATILQLKRKAGMPNDFSKKELKLLEAKQLTKNELPDLFDKILNYEKKIDKTWRVTHVKNFVKKAWPAVNPVSFATAIRST